MDFAVVIPMRFLHAVRMLLLGGWLPRARPNSEFLRLLRNASGRGVHEVVVAGGITAGGGTLLLASDGGPCLTTSCHADSGSFFYQMVGSDTLGPRQPGLGEGIMVVPETGLAKYCADGGCVKLACAADDSACISRRIREARRRLELSRGEAARLRRQDLEAATQRDDREFAKRFHLDLDGSCETLGTAGARNLDNLIIDDLFEKVLGESGLDIDYTPFDLKSKCNVAKVGRPQIEPFRPRQTTTEAGRAAFAALTRAIGPEAMFRILSTLEQGRADAGLVDLLRFYSGVEDDEKSLRAMARAWATGTIPAELGRTVDGATIAELVEYPKVVNAENDPQNRVFRFTFDRNPRDGDFGLLQFPVVYGVDWETQTGRDLPAAARRADVVATLEALGSEARRQVFRTAEEEEAYNFDRKLPSYLKGSGNTYGLVAPFVDLHEANGSRMCALHLVTNDLKCGAWGNNADPVRVGTPRRGAPLPGLPGGGGGAVTLVAGGYPSTAPPAGWSQPAGIPVAGPRLIDKVRGDEELLLENASGPKWDRLWSHIDGVLRCGGRAACAAAVARDPGLLAAKIYALQEGQIHPSNGLPIFYGNRGEEVEVPHDGFYLYYDRTDSWVQVPYQWFKFR